MLLNELTYICGNISHGFSLPAEVSSIATAVAGVVSSKIMANGRSHLPIPKSEINLSYHIKVAV